MLILFTTKNLLGFQNYVVANSAQAIQVVETKSVYVITVTMGTETLNVNVS